LKKNNFAKKKQKKKKGKVSKKKKKLRGKTLWITAVIHSVLCVGEQ
jgi:hypothetical protein